MYIVGDEETLQRANSDAYGDMIKETLELAAVELYHDELHVVKQHQHQQEAEAPTPTEAEAEAKGRLLAGEECETTTTTTSIASIAATATTTRQTTTVRHDNDHLRSLMKLLMASKL